MRDFDFDQTLTKVLLKAVPYKPVVVRSFVDNGT